MEPERYDDRVRGRQECDRWGVYVFGALDVPRRTNRCVFEGTARGEKIVGSPFDDFLDGKGGNDRLFGGAGADTISGGQGADRIVGGAGADRIDGGRQRNVILAGPGDDAVAVANGWRDIVDCGTGRDTVIADSLDVLRHCEVRH